MAKHRPVRIPKPDPKLLARTLDDLFAELAEIDKQSKALRARSAEILQAIKWMNRKEFRHKWTAPFEKK